MSYCLKDFIGVKGFDTAPESGLFVNQLPGISLQAIQKTATSEKVTFVEVFNDAQDRAWQRLVTDMRLQMRKRFKIKTNRALFHLTSIDLQQVIPVSPHYRGLVADAGWDNNGFFSFHVATITVDLPGAHAEVVVKLFDRSGRVLDTLTIVDAVSGVNVIQVKKDYAASRLFIAIDATAIALKETVLSSELTSDFQVFMNGIFGYEPGVSGAEAHPTTPWLIGQTITTYGISASIMPVCDYSAIICWNKELFANAWLNLLGAELMNERLFSDRVNKYTTVDAEKASDLKDLYTGLYENALDDTISGLQISGEDGCIECKQIITRRETLP